MRYTADGPLLVPGPVSVELPDGRVATSDRVVVALCLCKRSRIFPFCDTSHRRKGKSQHAKRAQPGT
ncbi:CDGSH iron-sulfur domain-containing protein [Hoyosella subflava]|uniref:Zinc finger CDGSH-type domain protein n=1 Tax=Hoyosella subflava (strain DSM 45089 / JCM 17490 / NBRC 109087 / DQS3-9A1) TaxID=443218 RepID=F6EGC1_HOYSD|nr:Zinc finger CDGSH-type domain protein [Hoyosella subflava DQS3-9A1]